MSEGIIKQCNTCSIVLTDANKIKDRNLCRTCNAEKRREYYKKTHSDGVSKKEEKLNAVKTCTYCDKVLTDENRVKNRNSCKTCTNNKYKEYCATKLATQYSTFDGTKKHNIKLPTFN
jgi:hypothetical protein